jgi:hypothetical protein
MLCLNLQEKCMELWGTLVTAGNAEPRIGSRGCVPHHLRLRQEHPDDYCLLLEAELGSQSPVSSQS